MGKGVDDREVFLQSLAGRDESCALLRAKNQEHPPVETDWPLAGVFTTYFVILQTNIHKTQAIASFLYGIDSHAGKINWALIS